MAFKKLNEPLLEALERIGYESPLPFQKKLISKIKSGVNLFGIGPEGSGKTTAMIIGTLQKLESEAFEDSPRALIYVKDKAAAVALEEEFKRFTQQMDLRIFTAYEGPDIEKQKETIYFGMDIVIGTPGRLKKLFKISGIHVTELKLVIVEDAEFLVNSRDFNDFISIPSHIPRCQYLVFSTETNSKIERLKDLFMEHSIELRQE